MRSDDVDFAALRLLNALGKQRSVLHCHRLWSRLIRLRDGNVCVVCGSSRRVSAHHILRRCFFEDARFEPGNGISLCSCCHIDVHAKYNGAPDFALPMDEQGGENIECMVYLIGRLIESSRNRGARSLDGLEYYVSPGYIELCRRLQGLGGVCFSGAGLEQVYKIWNSTSGWMLRDLILVNENPSSRSFVNCSSIDAWRG